MNVQLTSDTAHLIYLFIVRSVLPVPTVPDNSPHPYQSTLPTVLSRTEVKLAAGVKLLQSVGWKATVVAILDDLISVHDNRYEEGEHHVDEEADEGV